jgi:hypothetical protein
MQVLAFARQSSAFESFSWTAWGHFCWLRAQKKNARRRKERRRASYETVKCL